MHRPPRPSLSQYLKKAHESEYISHFTAIALSLNKRPQF
ncbi:hypothetical protein VDG1235_1512 [Verrucomicrobiia bacterium DG1235]|nr:hypothetical protein VDG1235_1512 [Verrucomicrobiae bacterium DG1235]